MKLVKENIKFQRTGNTKRALDVGMTPERAYKYLTNQLDKLNLGWRGSPPAESKDKDNFIVSFTYPKIEKETTPLKRRNPFHWTIIYTSSRVYYLNLTKDKSNSSSSIGFDQIPVIKDAIYYNPEDLIIRIKKSINYIIDDIIKEIEIQIDQLNSQKFNLDI